MEQLSDSRDDPVNSMTAYTINASHSQDVTATGSGDEDFDPEIFVNPLETDMLVRTIFILLYSAVFTVCFIGNILVILVIALHRQMRTITNFFLANLSVADLCVGVFCVMPNLSTYLHAYWILGKAMCKLYYFIQATCYTASVCILTVISLERYVAIIYPIHTRRLHSMCLLRSTVIIVWCISAACGLPFLIVYTTIQVGPSPQLTNSTTFENIPAVEFCVAVGEFHVAAFNITNLVLCYILPLCLMSFVYARISVVLWKSSRLPAGDRQTRLKLPQQRRRSSSDVTTSLRPAETVNLTRSSDVQKVASYSNCNVMRNSTKVSMTVSAQEQSTSSDNVMTSRRRVIRLLVAVVGSFAICVLPYHIRVVWQTASKDLHIGYWQQIMVPSTFLVYYLNSALNPVLYAFLSDKFRNSLYDLVVKRRCRSNQRGSGVAGRMTTGQQQAMTLRTFNANNSTVKLTATEHSMNAV